MPQTEASAEVSGRQNFASRNWFEQLFTLRGNRPPQRAFAAPPQRTFQAPRGPSSQRSLRNTRSRATAATTRVRPPRREENIDPDGEPAAQAAPDIAVYTPTPLVPLKGAPLAPAEAAKITDPVSAALLAELTADKDAAIRVTAEERDAILAYYKARDFIPAWVGVTGLNERGRGLLSEMAKADDEGLVAQDYLPGSLTSFKDTGETSTDTPRTAARLDLELTAAALKYARHAMSGRTEPNKITNFNDLNPPKIAPAEVLKALNETKDTGSYLASLHPNSKAYLALKSELQKLRGLELTAEALPEIRPGSVIKLGMRDERVRTLRIRLASLGLLDSEVAISSASAPIGPDADDGLDDDVVVNRLSMIKPDPIEGGEEGIATAASLTVASTGTAPVGGVIKDATLYDAELMQSVKAFQRQEGLKPDGIVGNRTLAAFNDTSVPEKIEKVLLNMERIRWLPRNLGDRYVLVNQPAFEVRVVENDVEIHRTNVVIGTATNQTPSFSDVMETIEFNPYWYVPRSIATKEMLPRSKRDPGYLTRSGYEVVNARGQAVSSRSVNWRKYSAQTMPVSVRQPPGRSNALGEMKFLFPNSHAVYLHDTPSKSLFRRKERAFSHGCVRVENPRELAEVLLRPDGWTEGRIASAIATGKNNGVKLKHRLDVHLVYMTAWPDEDGTIRYYDDVYGRDGKLSKALAGKTASLN
ncbi:L,D-transpeptidase family protein [Rhodoligotrophos ferricapiens]|uniref:L,D-transpeptidase family protein n=1 Tax=Rhodoligotrophos ferricapiens TaxID=3069264 RepID=UPI00315DBD3B